MKKVVTILHDAGVRLKLRKCAFLQASVDYLGHSVLPEKLKVATGTANAIRQAQPPRTHTELRSFACLCIVYRRFVQGFAKISAPHNAMLKKGTPSEFEALTDDQYEAFRTLNDKLPNPPILALPKPNRPFDLDTDASDVQVDFSLQQEQESPKNYRPIGYWSRTLTSAERNYSTTEKECLATVWSVLTLRPYLEGTRFAIRTDHDSLRWLLNITDASSRLARWRLRLSEYDYEITYRPGIKHQAADALSRIITDGTDDTPLHDLILTPFTDDGRQDYTETEDLMGKVQSEDPEVKENEVYLLNRETVQPNSAPPKVNAVAPEEEELLPITIEELLQAQVEDKYCKETAEPRPVNVPDPEEVLLLSTTGAGPMANRTELCIVRTDPRVSRQPLGLTEALPCRMSNGICRNGYI
ncbi:unnamed protein product [Agarophyton chilense]